MKLARYKALFILFGYLLGGAVVYALKSGGNPMPLLMGLFFVSFSFFKIIHLPEFRESFARYDLLAKYVPGYGAIYPFIEIVLGTLFLAGLYLDIASLITIGILLSTNIGVIIQLHKGSIIECACLGKVFDLPLSSVTVIENTAMIIMACVTLVAPLL